MPSLSGLSTWPTRPTVNPVLCGSSAWHQGPKAIGRGASVRFAVSCLHLPPLNESPSFSERCGSRRCGSSYASPHLDHPLASAICGGASPGSKPAGGKTSCSSTSCPSFAPSLELARSTRMQCLVRTTAVACHRRRRSRFSRHELVKEELVNTRSFFNTGPLPLSESGGRE